MNTLFLNDANLMVAMVLGLTFIHEMIYGECKFTKILKDICVITFLCIDFTYEVIIKTIDIKLFFTCLWSSYFIIRFSKNFFTEIKNSNNFP